MFDSTIARILGCSMGKIRTKAAALALLLLLWGAAAAEDEPNEKPGPADRLWTRVLAASKPRPLLLEPSIRCRALLSRDGDALYGYLQREVKQRRQHYDLVHEDLATGSTTVLADAGTYYYSPRRAQDLILGAQRVKRETSRHLAFRLLAFRGTEQVAHPAGSKVMSAFAIANGHFVFSDAKGLKLLSPDGAVRPLLQSTNIRNIWIGFPDHNAIVFAEGAFLGDKVFSYLTFDPETCKTTRKDLFRSSATRDFGRLCAWTDARILFWESRDRNGDGRVDFRDEGNTRIRSCSLETGKIETVIEREFEPTFLVTHPCGIFLVGERLGPSHKGRTRVYFVNPLSGAQHRVAEMRGKLCHFTLDADWTKLVFFQVTDTTGDGRLFFWHDRSKGYVVHLPTRGGAAAQSEDAEK